MSGNVHEFPGLNDVERDLVELGLADPDSLRKVREVRRSSEEILGFHYLNALLERVESGRPVLPEGFDPASDPIPHQYAHHFDLLDLQDLDLFRRLADLALDKADGLPVRFRKELFRLRSEAAGRIEKIRELTGEVPWKDLRPSDGSAEVREFPSKA